MKRMISLLLSLALLLCLPACAHHVDAPKEPVQFYYPRHTDQLQYGDPQGVITHELREAAGYTDRYSYLLNLYLRGPVTQGLRDPFPNGISVISLETAGNSAELVLSDSFAQLSGMDLTVACACLTLTLHSLTGIERLTVTTQGQQLEPEGKIVMRLSDILFMDNSTEAVRD